MYTGWSEVSEKFWNIIMQMSRHCSTNPKSDSANPRGQFEMTTGSGAHQAIFHNGGKTLTLAILKPNNSGLSNMEHNETEK